LFLIFEKLSDFLVIFGFFVLLAIWLFFTCRLKGGLVVLLRPSYLSLTTHQTQN